MARRAAGSAGPLHSAQDPAPAGHGADHRADTSPDGIAPPAPRSGAEDAEDLERLRETLLHGRAAHARPPLRVEDPVHLPPGAGTGWSEGWPDGTADPDDLAGGESAVMHPDDLAALHALPTTTAETRAWAGDCAQDDAWPGHPPEPATHQAGGRRLVGTAQDLSLWEDDPSWDGGRSWDDEPSLGDERPAGLLQQRWLQLTVCAVLALVVGAALALALTGRQVDAARAEADRQRQAASSAQADLVRERAARASERPTTAPAPLAPAAPAAPPEDLSPAPATSADPSVVAPPPPTDWQPPPVAEAPAPTADPGPPPPGPSPAAPPDGQGGTAPSSARSSTQDAAGQDAADQDVAGQDADAAPPDGQACSEADGTGGDGPATCP